MRKLSDFKGDAALNLLEELIDPIGEIAGDQKIIRMFQKRDIKGAAKSMLGEHRGSVIQILATLDGITPEKYLEQVSIFTVPMALLDLLNDPDLVELFRYQGQATASSGSGSETSEENR